MLEDSINSADMSGESYEDQILSLEVLSSKLRSFAKENFPEFSANPVTHLDIIRDSAALRSFNLPKEYNEFFITFDTAKYLFISDAPIITKCEEYIAHSKRVRSIQNENLFEIKKFYLKWCIEKNERETEYFALSTLNLIERNANKENFMKYFYAANIFIFGSKRRSLAKALEYLELAEKTLAATSLQDDYKVEISYIIQLFKGFAYISDNDKENAGVALSEALVMKQNGVTANLFSVLYPLSEDESQLTLTRLNSVVDYDVQRFSFAIEHNNLNLFNFFLRTAITYNIFRVPEFAPSLLDIKTILEVAAAGQQEISTKLYQTTSLLKGSNYSDYFTDKFKKDLDFSISFLERYKSFKNLFVSLSLPKLQQKMVDGINTVKQNLKGTIYSNIMKELDVFDVQLRELFAKIQHLGDELEKNKAVIKIRSQESVDETEKKYNTVISSLESKISNIDSSTEYDPASVFNNIMVYNVIISIVLFIIGGFISSFGHQGNTQISDMFGSIFIYGVKWGGFVFLGGLIIALISSASKVLERSNEKHRLQKKLTACKNQKERALERLKKDLERRILAVEEAIQSRVKESQKKIDLTKVDKEEREKELKEYASKEISEHLKKIDELVKIST